MHKFKKQSQKNVVGLKLSGTLTREEYGEIVPYLEEKIKKYKKIRLLVELDHWEGWGPYAALKDIQFVFKNSFSIERVAFVINTKEDRRAVLLDQPFSPWFRNKTRYFRSEEIVEAWEWLSEGVKGVEFNFDTNTKPRKKRKVRYGPKMEVLIIGGGVSGIAMAALLQQRGFEPRLVEARPQMHNTDKMLNLWPTATSVLKSIGLYKKLEKNSCVIDAFELYSDKEKLLEHYDFSFLKDKYGPLLGTSQGQLIKILCKGILPNVLRKGVAATKIDYEEGAQVKVNFSDGTKGYYDCVVCADGVHSPMRDLVFGPKPAKYGGMMGWGFKVKCDFDLPHTSFGYRGNNSYIKYTKVGDQLYVLAALKHEEIKNPDSKELDLLKKTFKGFPGITPKVLESVKDSDSLWFGGFYELKLKERVLGPIALLGQAANCFVPTTLLADTMALEAAYELSEELCRSDSEHVAVALKRFQAKRLKRYQGIRKRFISDNLQNLGEAKKLSEVSDLRKEIIPADTFTQFWSWFCDDVV